MTEDRLPQWGMGMKEGTIVEWTKAIGDRVEEGDVLAVVENEKVETELTSSHSLDAGAQHSRS